ncbi:MAG: methyltransferase domain-containing protein [Desulfobacteraceae bacterium]|nr:methyltransferase domain-containing protein [Desulfobacteraceae bacterium]
MNDTIFTENFWIDQWNNIKQKGTIKTDDTYKVHKGFSTQEYWDTASLSYNTKNEEISSRKVNKIIKLLKADKLIFDNCSVLEIGCGTGLLARELAKNKCRVTALDFSKGMLERCKKNLAETLKDKITFLLKDWNKIDLAQIKWINKFDLVVAFMSPATSTPKSFFKMMRAAKQGCVIKGWASNREHNILDALWEKIMDRPLKDKPQTFLFKLNLLFSMGYFPELTFDKIKWEEEISIEKEFKEQFAFFRKVSDKDDAELETIIKTYLKTIAVNNLLIRKHEGTTATAFWHLRPDLTHKVVK